MKRNEFSPYSVKDSGLSTAEVFEQLNRNLHTAYGPDYRVGSSFRLEMEPLAHFRRLLRQLTERGVCFATHRDMAMEDRRNDVVTATIRHDVDIDVVAALDLARIEHEFGVSATFYILHTSPYYGEFREGVFYRNDCLIRVYREIQSLGHEIAIHTDPLHIYQTFGVDGAEAFVTELEWLRSHGIEVRGTCAHNSAPVYGAENRAIFKGRLRPDEYRSLIEAGRAADLDEAATELSFNGKRALLQQLDEAELGLEYEALDIQEESKSGLKCPNGGPLWEYAALRGANSWNATLARRKIRHTAREAFGTLERQMSRSLFATNAEVVQVVRDLKPGAHVLLNIHPVYYGRRARSGGGPVHQLEKSEEIENDTIGWTTWHPFSLVARHHDAGKGGDYFQSVNMSNELGMLDLPVSIAEQFADKAPNPLRILFLGGANLDGATVNLDTQIHTRTRLFLSELTNRPVATFKMAHPGMGLGRLIGWLEYGLNIVKPDVVVLGIGAGEASHSLSDFWAPTTGFAPRFPPGDYLEYDNGEVVRIGRSAAARMHRRAPMAAISGTCLVGKWPEKAAVSREDAIVRLGALVGELVGRIREVGALPVLLLEDCDEKNGAWTNEKDAKAAIDEMGGIVSRWAEIQNVSFCNPYLSILGDLDGPVWFWGKERAWSEHTHQMAALALTKTIIEMGERGRDTAQDDNSRSRAVISAR